MLRHLSVRKLVVLTALLPLILSAWGIHPSRAQTPLGPEPAVDRFYCEEILEVSLNAGNVSDLRGLSVDLGFDPAVISPIAVLPGDVVNAAACDPFLQWLNPAPGENHLQIDLGMLGCSISGSGELLKLRFVGVANGQSPLTVNSAILRNSQNQDLPYLVINSVVDYRCPRPGTVTFDPPDGSFGCNQTLAVDILIDDYTLDLHGASLEISFDNNVVQPLSVTAGSLVSGAACLYYLDWLNPGPTSSTIQVDFANLGCSIDGPGAIVHMVFKGVIQGISPLDCVSLIFRNSANQPIEMDCAPATIEYRCPVPTESRGWGMFKATFGNWPPARS